MGIQSVAGVFSRYFVVGFFLPAFFTTLAAAHVIDSAWLPHVYTSAESGAQVLVVGGAALLLALLLSALHNTIIRALEGYWVRRLGTATGRGARLKRRINRALMGRVETRYDRLVELREDPDPSPERTAAAQKLDNEYPYPRRTELLPSRLGNTIRAFEVHPRRCYGLAGVTIWPRIELLLSDGERTAVENSQTNFSFFVNAAVLLGLLGLIVIADAIAHDPLPWAWYVVWIPYAIPFVAAFGALRATIRAAQEWGDSIKAAIDVHRLELYRRLGVRQPRDPEDEASTVARAVNRLLLYGEPLAKDLRIEEQSSSESTPTAS